MSNLEKTRYKFSLVTIFSNPPPYKHPCWQARKFGDRGCLHFAMSNFWGRGTLNLRKWLKVTIPLSSCEVRGTRNLKFYQQCTFIAFTSNRMLETQNPMSYPEFWSILFLFRMKVPLTWKSYLVLENIKRMQHLTIFSQIEVPFNSKKDHEGWRLQKEKLKSLKICPTLKSIFLLKFGEFFVTE